MFEEWQLIDEVGGKDLPMVVVRRSEVILPTCIGVRNVPEVSSGTTVAAGIVGMRIRVSQLVGEIVLHKLTAKRSLQRVVVPVCLIARHANGVIPRKGTTAL